MNGLGACVRSDEAREPLSRYAACQLKENIMSYDWLDFAVAVTIIFAPLFIIDTVESYLRRK